MTRDIIRARLRACIERDAQFAMRAARYVELRLKMLAMMNDPDGARKPENRDCIESIELSTQAAALVYLTIEKDGVSDQAYKRYISFVSSDIELCELAVEEYAFFKNIDAALCEAFGIDSGTLKPLSH